MKFVNGRRTEYSYLELPLGHSKRDKARNKLVSEESRNWRTLCAQWGLKDAPRKRFKKLFINNTPVLWKSRKQNIEAQTTFESEFIALGEIVKPTKYVKVLLDFMTNKVNKPILVSVIINLHFQLLKRTLITRKSGHIEVRYHKKKYEKTRISTLPYSNQIHSSRTLYNVPYKPNLPKYYE